mgnify:CR=1 FL=1
MFFMKNKENLILKLARKCGENSIGRCFGWFNQPKVPAKLKEKSRRVHLYINSWRVRAKGPIKCLDFFFLPKIEKNNKISIISFVK